MDCLDLPEDHVIAPIQPAANDNEENDVDDEDPPQDASPAPEMTQPGPTPDVTGSNVAHGPISTNPDVTENAGTRVKSPGGRRRKEKVYDFATKL